MREQLFENENELEKITENLKESLLKIKENFRHFIRRKRQKYQLQVVILWNLLQNINKRQDESLEKSMQKLLDSDPAFHLTLHTQNTMAQSKINKLIITHEEAK